MGSNPRSNSYTSAMVRMSVRTARKTIRYVTIHFQDRCGACERKSYPVWYCVGDRAIRYSVNRARTSVTINSRKTTHSRVWLFLLCLNCLYTSFALTGQKRKLDSQPNSSKRRKLSRGESSSKLDLIEIRARARIKARIRERTKIKEAHERRLAALRALKENGWSDLMPYEVLLRIFRLVVKDSGPVPFLCR